MINQAFTGLNKWLIHVFRVSAQFGSCVQMHLRLYGSTNLSYSYALVLSALSIPLATPKQPRIISLMHWIWFGQMWIIYKMIIFKIFDAIIQIFPAKTRNWYKLFREIQSLDQLVNNKRSIKEFWKLIFALLFLEREKRIILELLSISWYDLIRESVFSRW